MASFFGLKVSRVGGLTEFTKTSAELAVLEYRPVHIVVLRDGSHFNILRVIETLVDLLEVAI